MAEAGMVQKIAAMQDYDLYRDLAWDGSFEEYLDLVRNQPKVVRNAFERVYDMILSYGTAYATAWRTLTLSNGAFLVFMARKSGMPDTLEPT